MALKDLLMNLPEVSRPTEKRLSFNVKLKWTLIVLAAFFVLANIPIWGLAKNALERFEYLAIILGTDFGSIISLGIGPIVMASIILQLLVGSKIIDIDLTSADGKRYFEGIQKLLTIFFVVFEAIVYVMMRGLEAMPGYTSIVIVQLIIGGLLIVFMDEVVQKWGFGSGVSLFIAAGVSWRLFTSAFGFISKVPTEIAGATVFQTIIHWPFSAQQPVGKVFVFFFNIIEANPTQALLAAAAIIFTAIIFLVVVYAQSIKVEIPLSFERVRGFGIRWPLNLFYTSVIPVILTAALLANIQLFARLIENAASACTPEFCTFGATIASKFAWLGTFSAQGIPETGLAFWLNSPRIVEALITGSFITSQIWQVIFHILFFVGFSIIFALFWVRTSGMDASSQAKQIMSSGLQIPGFRKDPRVLESVLNRYILPLTVMGGAAIGLLASAADVLGALVSGTAILLVVMIIYKLYEDIAQQHAYDMHPALAKFMKT